jgi:enamine deaminase RidA (YjgF/YER057c/UK114 family)
VNEAINPTDIAPPAAPYSHAILVPAGSTMLYTAGVVPTAPDGSTPDDLGAQAEQVWASIQVILEAANMVVTDIVSITTYVVAGNELGAVMAARNAAMAGHRPASTLVTVPALARPDWKLEISVVAAR